MISVSNLAIQFGKRVLYKDVNMKFTNGNIYGVIGANGAGKSTLLKAISGELEPTKGSVELGPGERLSVLSQDHFQYDDCTVLNTVLMGHTVLWDIMQQRDALYAKADFSDEDGIKVAELEEKFAEMGGYNAESDAAALLSGLGIKEDKHYALMGELSGKEKVRIMLAKALFGEPDNLLLDEPTNHLDIESIQWLENFIATRANAVILVSHDRAFIDNVTTRTIEISLGRIYDYQVNYSRYVVLRQERLEQQMRAYENQQKQIQDTEAFIERFRYKATKSVQVQSRIKQLAKLERVEVDEVDTSRLNLKFPPAPRSGDYPIIAEGVGKNYGSHVVFSNATFTIKRGEKVAFVGKNGEGKSTLVKCIMGEIPYTGTLKIGHNVKIGYFAQNQASLLDESITVFDTIDRVAVGDIRTKIRDILGAFMFGGEASDKKVKVLSGGEKTRLAMIRLLLEPVNLLILDEPTNHLDMRTKDVLKQAIRDFNGTVILVSHDREFLDGLVSKVYEFGGGQVREHLGGIYDFLESRKLDSLRELEQRATVSKTEKDGNISKDSASPAQSEDSKLSYGEQKEFARRLRKAEKVVADIESEIAGLEKRIAEVEEKLATPDGAADTSLYELHGQLKKQLDDVMWKWSEASEVLDKLQK